MKLNRYRLNLPENLNEGDLVELDEYGGWVMFDDVSKFLKDLLKTKEKSFILGGLSLLTAFLGVGFLILGNIHASLICWILSAFSSSVKSSFLE